ncbi:MAG: Type 1 glutamine amidotransferase-like domain-containing protein [Polyangia bacterium]
MRLYLSSYRLGDDEEAILGLVPVGSRVAVSANALDGEAAVVREKIVSMERELFASLGYVTDELDLRAHFGRATLPAVLSQHDLVWTTGGNTFVLNTAIRLSGFDVALRALLDDDLIAYGGYSAGAVVAGPSLRGVEHADPIDGFPSDYPSRTPIWSGMGLVDYVVAPHAGDPHIDAMIAELAHREIPCRPLRDGEVIIVR